MVCIFFHIIENVIVFYLLSVVSCPCITVMKKKYWHITKKEKCIVNIHGL